MLIQVIGVAARLLVAPLSLETERQAPVSSYMALGPSVPPPIGYVRFCERRPDHCSEGSSPAAEGETPPLPLDLGAGPEASDRADLKPSSVGPGDLGPSVPLQDALIAAPTALPDAKTAPLARPRVITITEASWAALKAVNRSINDKIRPMSDEAAFGMSNYWTLPLEDEHRAVGNCKHYALEKRKALIDAGLSPDALSLAIVRTSWGELHAVLVVATDRGELVLDNLNSRILGWKDARYLWLARQAPGRPFSWVSVAQAR
jgi:predicted transglutaminase-like cysteine proteinase